MQSLGDEALMGCRQVKLGRLQSAEIGIGTWQWGNRFLWSYTSDQDEELGLLFEKCVQSGINFFDTADSCKSTFAIGCMSMWCGVKERRREE